jgi:2-keto-4-pentenoate hydratase
MAPAGSPSALDQGMRALLARRAAELAGGSKSVGWKVGINVPALQAHFGLSGPVVGYLTDATVLDAGSTVDVSGWQRPALEVEVAVRVGSDGAVAGLAPALELVDLDLPFDELSPILEGNIFHRGVIFGPEVRGADISGLAVAVHAGADEVARGQLGEPPEVTMQVVRAFLAAHGAELVAGDRIIAGTMIAPHAVTPGDDLHVSFGALGALQVNFC